jgi:uncharacterized membrane protein YozB (DUF420 family)
MTAEKIDFIFPFFPFLYGFFYILVFESRIFKEKGENYLKFYYKVFLSHRPLAIICFFVGGLWILQNLLVLPA